MSSFTFNAGSKALQDGTVNFVTATIKILLLGAATPWTPDKDAANLTTIAASELNVAGYNPGFGGTGRKALTTKAITNDTANDRTEYSADNPAMGSPATGDQVTGAIVYAHITSDALSIPLFYLDCPDTPTNGAAMTITFPGGIIGYTQQ